MMGKYSDEVRRAQMEGEITHFEFKYPHIASQLCTAITEASQAGRFSTTVDLEYEGSYGRTLDYLKALGYFTQEVSRLAWVDHKDGKLRFTYGTANKVRLKVSWDGLARWQ